MNEKCFTFIVTARVKRMKAKSFLFNQLSIILASFYVCSNTWAWTNKKIRVNPCIHIINLYLKTKEKKYDY
jgi:hypothetical protein